MAVPNLADDHTMAESCESGLTIVVNQLMVRQESDEYETARALYDPCVANFASCLTLKHLKLYRCSSDEIARYRSIYLLSETLTDLRDGGFRFSLASLCEIKPLLVSCLTMQKPGKSDTRILRRIVSFVADDILVLHNGGWNELADCILSLANSDPIRAFNIFLDLPPVCGEFIDRFEKKLLEEVYKMLFDPEQDWTLALETAVKMGIQLLGCSEMKSALTKHILRVVQESADKLVRNGIEQYLLRGLEDLIKFLSQDANLCNWSSCQYGFLSKFAFMIARIGKYTKEPAVKIFQMVTEPEKYVHDKTSHDRELYKSLKPFSALGSLCIFASADSDDISREMAIKRLHVLLCNHTSGKARIDVSEMRELQRLIIPCLREEGISDDMFNILGEVVFHIAEQIFTYEVDRWCDLWCYIASEKTGFERAVYIFQCLPIELREQDFALDTLNKLLPEIYERLEPPKELLVDNNCWVLAFTGSFCATINLLEVKSYALGVRWMVCKMIYSVKKLVEIGLEDGLVTRAFRDLERIVERQWKWYMNCEYKFVKGLLGKLDTIQGMGMESKMVLQRINTDLERNMHQALKQ